MAEGGFDGSPSFDDHFDDIEIQDIITATQQMKQAQSKLATAEETIPKHECN